ncbi:Dual specificity protein phosphatase 23 [Psilocybe cubensis]|uniref:Tyrosine specific protein phosphatases domain-containing protein n=2 Tax=Psilocybe cubensis TaxID=181762 RepID=A0A8H7YBK4_PSICU|nr:Dual specificity protein phosphatase 23 [Psilocybe cubensis]KAH9487456.1 Dual specificity protein phosphatase 23 [Psilocybe cubensis]
MTSNYRLGPGSSSPQTTTCPTASTSTAAASDHPDDLQHSQRKLQALFIEDIPRPLTAVCARPIPNSYWATPLLLACEYPWTPKNPNKPKLDALLRAGVRTFIDLTECGELLPYSSILSQRSALLGIDPATIEYHRFAIRDRCLPESINHMYRVLDTLRDNQERGRISAVHCRGGIGRTGMVIGCWLVESGIARDGKEALAIIAREWKTVEKCKRYPHSPETGAQFDFVAKFHPSPKQLHATLELESEDA